MRAKEKKNQRGIARRAAALFAALLAGCAIDDVELVGACTADDRAVRLVSETGAFSPQPALLDGQLLMAWVVPASDGSFEAHAAWFERDLMTTPIFVLGRQRGFGRTVWAREGDALVGQAFLGTDGMGLPLNRGEEALRIVRLPSDGTHSASPVSLPISTSDPTGFCPMCSHLDEGGTLLNGGADLRFPAIALRGQVVMAAAAAPLPCTTAVGNVFEPILFSGTNAFFTRTRPILCQDRSQDYPNNIGLLRGAGGSIGLLFRQGEAVGFGNTHYMMSDASGHPLGVPVQVGVTEDHSTADDGWDLHGVRLGQDGGVLFRERTAGQRGYLYLVCYRMRVFHGDGSDAADAAFQVGCVRSAGHYVTRSMDLVELSNGLAAVVWGERTGYGGLADLQQPITSSTPWTEGIQMAIVTPSGRRGSDVVRVTSDEATQLIAARSETGGPLPADFVPRAVSEGDRVVVTWRDERADAPGIYARSFHCRATSWDAGSAIDTGSADAAPGDAAP